MTIFCYRDGILAADTGSWCNGLWVSHRSKIIRSPDGHLAAACGLTSECYRFEKHLLGGAGPFSFDIKMEDAEDFSALVVLKDGSVWRINHQGMQIPIHAPYYADGGPYEFALGAMAAGAPAVTAVYLCIQHTAHAHGSVEAVSLDDALGVAA